MDLTFLDEIVLKEEVDGKEETVKSVRFSKDEFYMLKYCKFLNKKFSTFIKELINESINELENENKGLNINIDAIKEQLKNEVKKELLKELSIDLINDDTGKEKIENIEGRNDVLNFMNNRK